MRGEWWEMDGYLWAFVIVVVVALLVKLVIELTFSFLSLYMLWRVFDWLCGFV